MMWLLDTNVCIRFLNGRSPSLRTKLLAADPAQICVCSVVKAELFFGAAQSRDPAKARASQVAFLSRFPSLTFDDASAIDYAEIRHDLASRGQLIGPNDLLIAAICRSNDLTLITHNISEFGRVNGLKIEHWES